MAQTALITGASGGIGLDFAHKFAQNGYNVVLVARSQDKLQALADELTKKYNVSATVLVKDLTDPAAPSQIYDALQEQGIQVDVLVNNAGFATYGYFHELDMARELELLQVNIVALTHLTRLYLPGMVARRSGKILNVSSTAAFAPGPMMACYYASKAYVLYFSEALSSELAGKGVTVTALCPGPTESGFQERAAMTESKLVQGGLMDRKTVVDAGYDALMAGQSYVIPGWMNYLMSLAPRFTPRAMAANLVHRMQSRVGH